MTELRKELLDMGDYVMNRLDQRLDGMTDEEHLWEPQPGAWKVRPDRMVEHADPYGRPKDDPPLTTISWRLWHIGSQCLCGFAISGFGADPLAISSTEWWPDAGGSRDAVQRAWQGYRAALIDAGEERMHELLGPKFGPYAEATYAALVLHVLDEVIHHGAEVAMLRDLYRIRA